MNFETITTKEFYDICLNEEVSQLDMLNFVKRVTNKEKERFAYLFQDLESCYNDIRVYVPRTIKLEKDDIYLPFIMYKYNVDLSEFAVFILSEFDCSTDILAIKTREKIFKLTRNITDIGDRLSAIYNLSLVALDCYWFNIVFLNDIAKKEYNKLIEPPQTPPPPREEKTPLTFSGLFKHPYNQDLEKFKTILKSLNLIDENCSWREVDLHNNKVNKSDIGKFFNLLYNETTVFQKTDKRNDAICFCKEFGITAYKENEKPNTGRLVTVEQIVKSEYSKDEQTSYLAIIKRWIDKV